ncbi:MAG: hypothetical protein K5681_04570 [Treponema sp.]|nr:hypothetical protein [Treponema sp.]
MDNDNEVKIHQEVMMFLGDEVSLIHHNSQGQSYNIEKEYEKTRKNHSGFSIILLVSSLIVILAVAFVMSMVISSKNHDIKVSLEDFEDLNLKNLLNSVSAAQTSYDSALKVVARVDSDYSSALKDAELSRNNEIFVLDSLHLDSSQDYENRLRVINQRYEETIEALREDYSVKRKEAEEDAEMFRQALSKFDASAIESAGDTASLDSESQLHKLELKSQEDKYEKRIAQLEAALQNQREKNQEDMRVAINQVVEKYQAEIDKLDPKLSDSTANAIIYGETSQSKESFNGSEVLSQNEISEDSFVNAVSDYQKKYNQYMYLDDTVASIPQKYSIPEYVSAARSLVNSMSDSYMDTTLSYYEEKSALNQKIEEGKEEMGRRQQLYEQVMTNMLTGLKSNAAILSGSGYEDIIIYLAPQARYLVTEEEGAEAEFKLEKTSVKGSIIHEKDDEITGQPVYRFVVAEDKEGNLPELDFSLLIPGQTVKILSK